MPRPAARRPTALSDTDLSDTALSDTEKSRRALCAEVFANPGCVERVLVHDVAEPLVVEPHTHEGLLQLDLIDGCAGEVVQQGQRHPVAGVTVCAAAPGVAHGYTLRPEHRRARVCLLRLKPLEPPAGPDALPALRTGLPPLEHLAGLLSAAAETWTPAGTPLIAAAKLAEALCRWPATDESAGLTEASHGDAPTLGDALSDRVRRAVTRLARRVDDPPSLEELAAAASISPRHFARRFAADFNCTPHEYITARRLDAARALLLRPGVPVARVAEELGFASPSAFSRWFSRAAGQTPRAFQKDPGVF